MVSKNAWRAKMLDLRSQLGPDKASQMNRNLCKNILFVLAEGGGLGDPKNKPLWATYKSFRWEADPEQAVQESLNSVSWAYPRVRQPSDEPNVMGSSSLAQMDFLIPFEKDALWLKSQWGLWEPDPRTADKAERDSLVGILVPGVAFDRKGHRLGYGKGFYDKSLSEYHGLKVGVCFSVQLAEEVLPFDQNDVLMDYIVTNKEIIKVDQNSKQTRSL